MHITATLVQKIIYSIGMTVGPMLIALFVLDFKYATRGKYYYYTDSAEWGIATGIFILMLAIVSRKWR